MENTTYIQTVIPTAKYSIKSPTAPHLETGACDLRVHIVDDHLNDALHALFESVGDDAGRAALPLPSVVLPAASSRGSRGPAASPAALLPAVLLVVLEDLVAVLIHRLPREGGEGEDSAQYTASHRVGQCDRPLELPTVRRN